VGEPAWPVRWVFLLIEFVPTQYNRTPLFTLSTPMVVYMPPGDYVVTNTLVLWFLTHLIGNSLCPPRILLAPGTWPGGQNYVIAGDTSFSGDHDDEFYRGIAHIDIIIGANNGGAGGIHWAVSQATFLRDMVIDLSASGTYGIFDENGSGGFAADLTVIGGQIGLYVGNQQWTWLNINSTGGSQSCINQNWDWVSAWVGFSISNCPIGFQFPGTSDGSILLIDGLATNVPLVVQARGGNNIFVERMTATNVTMIVSTGLPGKAGGTVTVPGWRQGTAFTGNGVVAPGNNAAVPLTRADAPLERRPRPTFDGEAMAPVSVLSFGAKGDGVSDDTAALKAALAASPTVFLPYGLYLLSDTITMSAGSALVGELGSVLVAKGGNGSVWSDASNPKPLLLVPVTSTGVRLVDLLFTLSDDAPGLIFLAWQAPSTAPSGLWDVSWRVYFTASDLFLVSGDGAGVYWEEGWGWVADHDIETGQQVTVKNPRGMTITGTGAGPSWLYGTAMEHSSLYQYNFSSATAITTVVTQTETNYWSVPPTGWAMVHENAAIQQYGSGWYNCECGFGTTLQ
jgi:glucan 1,3-beta-glucosidase